MPHAYTQDQLVEHSVIDRVTLEARGWVSFILPSPAELDLRERLLALASGHDTPAATRSGGSLCDGLLPTDADMAKPRSLSKLHGVGEFPLHVDTAHWLTPCRYIMLAYASPGSTNRPTLLMDVRQLPLDNRQTSLLHCTPLRVTNGRNSFFSTILSGSRPFVRYDTGCMTATTRGGKEALGILSRHNWPNYVEQFHWEPFGGLIIDNWRVLHGRASADVRDHDRKLLRISIR